MIKILTYMFSMISIATATASILQPVWPLFAIFAVASVISGMLIKYTHEKDHRLEELSQINTKLQGDVNENFSELNKALTIIKNINDQTDKNTRSIENVALHLNIK